MTKLALITGASSGIGFELAKVMAANGHDLILVSRSQQKLDEVARGLEKQYSIKTHTLAFDLAQPKRGEELFKALQEYNDHIEILVNNAGFGDSGPFIEHDLVQLNEMLNLNMITLTELCHLYGAQMARRRRGAILNVASTAAFQPGPYMAAYFATKAYVLSLSEALRVELKDFNVQISTLCPGATLTQFQNRAGVADKPLFNKAFVMRPDEVARQAYIGMQKDRSIIITGFLNWLTAISSKFVPRAITNWVTARLTSSVLAKEK